ncbi:hypothetical protein EC957_003128 [Mortierella hygrophila]|uniref:Uncharacterized protein n=1 Tax=Mortierella hygrophila TaxID=979708 RepID=A0A9P6F2F4_9FUNG|nr:hypothetical protein EC957_003128 [Mortierella hygrophila]
MPKSLKRFFAVLEPGSNASKYQPESSSSQQQHQQQHNVFSQDKKSSTGEIIPPSTTTTTTNQPPAKQPDASYLAYQPAKLSNTQVFWQSMNHSDSMS